MLKMADKQNKDEIATYRSKIIDMDNQFFYLDYPIHIETDTTVFVPINEPLKVQFIKDGVANEFQTKVDRRVKIPMPALALPLPENDQIVRIQRREFVRVETNADVAVHLEDSSIPPFTTVTDDISGGGASIVIPPTIELNEKQPLSLYLVLRSSSLHYDYIKTRAEIVRFRFINNVQMMSVKFHLDSDNDQQKIIHYCFDQQREKRQQGLI